MAFTRFSTSEPWDPASGARLNKLGDELQEQINVLSDDRGYLKTKSLSFNLAIKNGKYIMANDTDCPDGSANSTWLIDVTQMNDSYVLQEAFCLYSPIGNTGRKYYRYMVNNVWQPWIGFATTTKTSFLCTAKPGCAITNQDCYVLNGIAYINIDVVKSDGTVFGVSQHGLFSSPYFKAYNIPINAIFTDGSLVAPMMYNGGLWNDGGCYITISSATAKKITVKCEVTL